MNDENRITTIGRGGSDASAIMIAKFFKAKRVYNLYRCRRGLHYRSKINYKKAKKIKEISYEEMLEMASLGAKVMQPSL